MAAVNSFCKVLILFVVIVVAVSSFFVESNVMTEEDMLSYTYYHESCPNAEKIIHNVVKKWVGIDHTLAPALMRLHFHDCAVRGCDASILLNHKGSEKWAKASKTLRGFEIIDEMKAKLELQCPKTVSCSDILAAVARDATVAAGGPFWQVPYGRKDGRVSISNEADSIVPMGHENVTYLIEFYQSKGLNVLDLVVLSGAHTIGRTSCGSIQQRLYNFSGTGKPDPSINPKYLNFLKRKCRWASEYVDLDANTPMKFDDQYFKNLENKMGLLQTDQILHSDSRTAPLVSALASQGHVFVHQFAASMVKLGNIQDYLSDGEIRTNCNYVNA